MMHILSQRRLLRLRQRLRAMLVIHRRFRRAHRLHKLRPGARRPAHDIPLVMPPVRRHLPPARRRIARSTHTLHQHFNWSNSQHQAKRAVAVIRKNPIGARTKKQPHCGRNRLMAGAGDLKENLILSFELDFPVIQPPGKKHRAIQPDQRIAVEPAILHRIQLCHLDASLHGHSVALVWKWVQNPQEPQLYRNSPRKCSATLPASSPLWITQLATIWLGHVGAQRRCAPACPGVKFRVFVCFFLVWLLTSSAKPRRPRRPTPTPQISSPRPQIPPVPHAPPSPAPS